LTYGLISSVLTTYVECKNAILGAKCVIPCDLMTIGACAKIKGGFKLGNAACALELDGSCLTIFTLT